MHPSFVNFNCVLVPPTNNFNVPVGPKFDCNTFCNPTAAAVFTISACCFDTISAFGTNSCMCCDDISLSCTVVRICVYDTLTKMLLRYDGSGNIILLVVLRYVCIRSMFPSFALLILLLWCEKNETKYLSSGEGWTLDTCEHNLSKMTSYSSFFLTLYSRSFGHMKSTRCIMQETGWTSSIKYNDIKHYNFSNSTSITVISKLLSSCRR